MIGSTVQLEHGFVSLDELETFSCFSTMTGGLLPSYVSYARAILTLYEYLVDATT